MPKRTTPFTDGRPKDIPARLADCFIARDAGDVFRRLVKGSDAPLLVNGEYTISDRIEYSVIL
jgi:hypothetical protein